MFKKHSLRIKYVKDDPTVDPIDYETINRMTPEELEELSRRLMRQIAINVAGVIAVKITVAVVLGIIAKKLDTPHV